MRLKRIHCYIGRTSYLWLWQWYTAITHCNAGLWLVMRDILPAFLFMPIASHANHAVRRCPGVHLASVVLFIIVTVVSRVASFPLLKGSAVDSDAVGHCVSVFYLQAFISYSSFTLIIIVRVFFWYSRVTFLIRKRKHLKWWLFSPRKMAN